MQPRFVKSANARRQERYREKHFKGEDSTLSHLNVNIDMHAKLRLERLAAHYAVTQKLVLEKMIENSERRILEKLSEEQTKQYFDKQKNITA
jgi:hypothetical protein